MCLWIEEEIRPVGIRLHVPELKQLPETQHQDLLTDLTAEQRNMSDLYIYINSVILIIKLSLVHTPFREVERLPCTKTDGIHACSACETSEECACCHCSQQNAAVYL